jgi:hypothetical protein
MKQVQIAAAALMCLPGTSMSHIALTVTVDGKNVQWMEKVSDQQYRK